MDEVKEEYRSELVDILDSYFDPSKEQVVPVARNGNNNRRRYKRGPNKENRKHKNAAEKNNNDVVATPDSTKNRRRSRRRFSTKRLSIVDTATINTPVAGTTDLTQQIGKSPAPEIAVA